MPEKSSLKSPRYWPSWLGVGLARLIAYLPYRAQMKLGDGLGTLARWLVPHRRHVARTNIQLAFPELSAKQQEHMLKAHFKSVGRAVAETAICWWGSDATIKKLSHIEGLENLQAAAEHDKGIILLSAHFTALELGVRIGQHYLRDLGRETTAMYKPPHDPVINHVMRSRREAHIGGKSIPHSDVRGFLRALKRGHAVWYAGDQRASQREGALVPFFGHNVQTHIAISRLAQMTGAIILPFFTLREQDGSGYKLIVLEALKDFPGESPEADAARLNQLIESVIRQAPEQYFWLHERFRIKGSEGFNPYEK